MDAFGLEDGVDEDYVNDFWTEGFYREVDPFKDLAPGYVLKDERYDRKHLEEQAAGLFPFIDEVCGSIESEEGSIDQDLRNWMRRFVLHVTQVNEESGNRPYSRAELRVLIVELWHVDHLHGTGEFGQTPRNDGTSYPRSHLFGSVLNAISLTGITDISLILALLHHDDYEDLSELHGPKTAPKPDRSKLLALHLYGAQILPSDLPPDFTGTPEEFLNNLQERVHGLVESVTNMKRMDMGKSDQDILNIRALYGKVKDLGPFVLLIRACERLHNLGTLEGMRKARKAKNAALKVKETNEILAPLVEILGFSHLYRELMQACFVDVDQNPRVLERFQTFRDQHIERRCEESGAVFRARVQSTVDDPRVSFVAFAPWNPFESEYLRPEHLTEPDFDPSAQIDPWDPLFTLEVLTREPQAVTSVRDGLLASLTQGHLLSVHPYKQDTLLLYNPELGGRVAIRVQSQRQLRLAQRGCLSPSVRNFKPLVAAPSAYTPLVEDKLPPEVEDRLERFIDLTRDSPPEVVREVMKRVLLHRRMTVLTPRGDAVDLPRGATALDLAGTLHPRILQGFQAVRMREGYHGSPTVLGPGDVLREGSVCEVIFDDGQLNVETGWMHCTAEPSTRHFIEHALKRYPVAVRKEKAGRHLDELATLLAYDSEEIRRLLKSLFPEVIDVDNLIARGAINPLEMLAEQVERKDGINFEIDLPNQGGVMEALLRRYGRPFLNLSFLDAQKDFERDGQARTKLPLRFGFENGVNLPLYELLALAYQISKTHPIKMSSTRFSRFSEERLGSDLKAV